MGILHESKLNKNLLCLDTNLHERYMRGVLRTTKMELLAKIVSGFKLLTVLAKSSTFDVCNGSKYTSEYKIL